MTRCGVHSTCQQHASLWALKVTQTCLFAWVDEKAQGKLEEACQANRICHSIESTSLASGRAQAVSNDSAATVSESKMAGKSSNWEPSGHTQVLDHLHGLLMQRKRKYLLGSMAQALARGAFKNNNSKRLSHVSDPEAIAKHNLRLHNSTRFTGTPPSEHWARHDSVS